MLRRKRLISTHSFSTHSSLPQANSFPCSSAGPTSFIAPQRASLFLLMKSPNPCAITTHFTPSYLLTCPIIRSCTSSLYDHSTPPHLARSSRKGRPRRPRGRRSCNGRRRVGPSYHLTAGRD